MYEANVAIMTARFKWFLSPCQQLRFTFPIFREGGRESEAEDAVLGLFVAATLRWDGEKEG